MSYLNTVVSYCVELRKVPCTNTKGVRADGPKWRLYHSSWNHLIYKNITMPNVAESVRKKYYKV